MTLLKKIFWGACTLTCLIAPIQANFLEANKKEGMIEDLKIIKHTLEVGYAPLEWKKSHSGWDLNEEFEKAKRQILDTSPITVKDFQRIAKSFLASLHDYHTDMIFYSSESATLPFTIRGADNRYFIDWIDTNKLPPAFYPIHEGDEVLSFNGRALSKVIDALKVNENGSSNSLTEQAMAEIKFTERLGMRGDEVPKKSGVIEFKSATTGKTQAYQIMWNYQPELMTYPNDYLLHLDYLFPEVPKRKRSLMMCASHRALAKGTTPERGLGGRKSFIPPLGPQIWELDKKEKDKKISWYAYIFETAKGRKIGYLRIPHYYAGREETRKFEKIISLFEQETDALVIDQVHNTGGFVGFSYDLLSMLTNVPLKTPKHRIKNTQREVLLAYFMLKVLQIQQSKIEQNAAEEAVIEEKEDDPEDEGLPKDYQKLLFYKDFLKFTIDEWNAGRSFTNPTHLEGADQINPHPTCRYTKPIIMLINELDFSGGDFVPAILQDNKRAVLFGSRTSGAGGFVMVSTFPNENGIMAFTYTGSLAERPDSLLKIENLGVMPDIEYTLTVEDLQNGYQGYVSAVNEAIEDLFENKEDRGLKIEE